MFPIRSESQLIDLNTIDLGCQKLKSGAQKILKSKSYVEEAVCEADTLKFGFKNPSKYIAEYAESLVECASDIDRIANSILESAQSIYEKQHKQLQQYREFVRRQQEAERRARENN